MKKKILSILLAAIMIVGILPTVAFADGISTVADVLATVDDFPTRPVGQGTTIPENAWTTTNGNKMYNWGGILYFNITQGTDAGENRQILNGGSAQNSNISVTPNGNNYQYTNENATYTFVMNDSKLVSVNVNDTSFPQYNGTYTAPAPTYTVTFDANGHGTAPASYTDVASGTTINKPDDPTAAGYTFGGWYKEAGCTNVWNFATDTVTTDTTLYAKWTKTGGGHHHDSGSSTPTVTSATTADMGVAIYGVLTVSSLIGMGWVGKLKKRDDK